MAYFIRAQLSGIFLLLMVWALGCSLEQSSGGTAATTSSITTSSTQPFEGPEQLVAWPQKVITLEDTQVAINLGGNGPRPWQYRVEREPQLGILSGSLPNLVYTPAADSYGGDDFTFVLEYRYLDSSTISDPVWTTITSDPATVSVNVLPVNDPPFTTDINLTLDEDSSAAFSLLSSDLDGDPLELIILEAPQHGDISGQIPNLVYTAQENYFGPDSLLYQATDASSASRPSRVLFTINPQPDQLVATNLSLSTGEDTAVAVTLSVTDPDNLGYNLIILNHPDHGLLSGTEPRLTYFPNPDYYGSDSFSYRAVNAEGQSPVAEVAIEINPINDPPQAVGRDYITVLNSAIAISLEGNDAEDGALEYQISTSPERGRLSGVLPNIIYTPSTGYFGLDYFEYTVADPEFVSEAARINIIINYSENLPVAADLVLLTNEDAVLAVILAGSDADGDTLEYSVLRFPEHGVLTGTAPALVYAPDHNYFGPDSFEYRVHDGHAPSLPAQVSITVSPVMDLPIANPQTVSTAEEAPVFIQLTGTDPDRELVAFIVVREPKFGVLSGIAPDLYYTPLHNSNGADDFAFKVYAGGRYSNPVTVNINVLAVNDPPVASNVIVETTEDQAIGVEMSAADIENNPVSFALAVPPTNGLVGIVGNVATYTPNKDFNGTDLFQVVASDDLGRGDPATVFVTIHPQNDPPVAAHLTFFADKNVSVQLALSALDVDGDSLTYSLVTEPTYGTLSGNMLQLRYNPPTDFVGRVFFHYQAYDNQTYSRQNGVVEIFIDTADPHPYARLHPIDQQNITADQIPISFELLHRPLANDLCNLLIEYRSGQAGGLWQVATISGQKTNLPPSAEYTLYWDYALDEPELAAVSDLQFRVVASDIRNEGLPIISEMFVLERVSWETATYSGHGNHSLLIKADGGLWSMGRNNAGELGHGDLLARGEPEYLLAPVTFNTAASGRGHSVALDDNGGIWGFGDNTYGMLGQGDTIGSLVPVPIGLDQTWTLIVAGADNTLALKNVGELWACGLNQFGAFGSGDNLDRDTMARVGTNNDWESLAAGDGFTLGIKQSNTLWGSGLNASGQLGLGHNSDRNQFEQVGIATTWRKVAAGRRFALGLRLDNSIWGWGRNSSGQLGTTNYDSTNLPVPIGADKDWFDLAAGRAHSLAIRQNGSLWSFGANNYGQLGLGVGAQLAVHSPQQIGQDLDWIGVFCNQDSSYAFKSDGTVWAWGSNLAGQLGQPGDQASSCLPEQIKLSPALWQDQ